MLAAIAWLVRDKHATMRVQGDWPITVSEVQVFLPEASRLRADGPPRNGLVILDAAGKGIGYAVRTMPEARNVVGYSGPTDALVVFDGDDKVAGVAIRHSYDTPSHVRDVAGDFYFMERWNGRTWDEIAGFDDFMAEGIYAVSGASRTSEALMEGITVRLAGEDVQRVSGGMRFGWRDGALAAFVLGGCLFAFWKRKSFQNWRWVYSMLTIAILGLVLGDLLAQSLLVGWAESRIPWEATPGVVLLAASAFLVPWFTRQPVYCQFICPHGNLQRWMMKVIPARWKRPLPGEGKWILRWIPPFFLAVVLMVSFWQLELDLAGIEPFDAYLLRSAGIATIAVALVGLAFSLFFPMAYCKFGCPTGWLLEFVRRRSGKGKFEERDGIGIALLALAIALHQDWLSL